VRVCSYCGFILLTSASLLPGCRGESETGAHTGKSWLQGDTETKLETLAKHLRGNDLVMMEVQYRYRELLGAGRTENWAYAEYQLEKIRLAMEMGKERRPKRGPSYDWFFENGLPPMEAVVKAKDAAAFEGAFREFTKACNRCHALEQVSHFNVVVPERVDSVIGWPPSAP